MAEAGRPGLVNSRPESWFGEIEKVTQISFAALSGNRTKHCILSYTIRAIAKNLRASTLQI